MDADLEPAWHLKLARAREHCENLDVAIREYLDDLPYELVPVDLPASRELRLQVATPPPNRLATIIGDVLHNLRSALDTRLVAVAERLVGSLTEDQERVLDVPLVATEAEYLEQTRSWRKRLPAVAEQLERVVAHLLPFGAPSDYWSERHGSSQSDELPTHAAMATRLVWLNQLSNIDKHRRLHLPWWSFGSLPASGGVNVSTATWGISRGPWKDRDVVVTLRLDDASGIALQGELTLVLPGQFGVHGGSAAAALENLCWFVERAVEVLEYEESSGS